MSLKIFKSEVSQILYIETVTEGHVEDFRWTRDTVDTDRFTIDRKNTSIVEVKKAKFDLFVNELGEGFETAQDFEDYLIKTIDEVVDVCSFQKAFSGFSGVVNQEITEDIEINGSYFTESTVVSIEGQVVNSVTFVSSNLIIANVSSGNVDGLFDVSIDNGCGVTLLEDAFEVKLVTYVDLRQGGDVLTIGNGAGNDVRLRTGMSAVRDANGMYFNGVNPWGSWVKFEKDIWNRSDNNKLEWIFTRPDSFMMIGIGSDATNETNNAQYVQAETLAYFNSGTNFSGLYGNNGTVGGTGNQNNNTSIAGGSGVFKIKFESNGGAGGVFTLYSLPSANESDWSDESNVLTTFTIAGSLNPDEPNIMPFIIPRAGGNQRFIAYLVD